jgi:hypothetical protein
MVRPICWIDGWSNMLDLIVHLGRAASSGFITHYAMGIGRSVCIGTAVAGGVRRWRPDNNALIRRTPNVGQATTVMMTNVLGVGRCGGAVCI